MSNILGQINKIILHLLSYMVRKDQSIWIFGEATGKQYYSNTKHFFEFVLQHKKEIRPIWFTKSEIVIKKVKTVGGEVYKINSLKALYYGLKAKVCVHSFGRDDVMNYTLQNTIFVNLYHGMNIKKLLIYNRRDDLDIATSAETKIKRKKVFPNCKNLLITGEPKNDIFFKEAQRKKILKKYNLEKYYDKIIISYLPTYRTYQKEFEPLFCNKPNFKNAVIFEKNHLLAVHNFHQFDNVINISKKDFDVQELLSITDILVTDYSSCYFDFLLTERPIISYLYDHERYVSERGLCYELDEFVIGNVCRNENEVSNEISAYLYNMEMNIEQRIRFKNKFHKYQEGNFSEKIFNKIIKLIG